MNHEENDIINVCLLMMPDMYPLPSDIAIKSNGGEKTVIDTNDQGEVLDIVKGEHMVLEATAKVLGTWLLELNRPFWMWDDLSNKFRRTQVSIVE